MGLISHILTKNMSPGPACQEPVAPGKGVVQKFGARLVSHKLAEFL